ncbi:hypothetical protein PR003_g21901 [Phytophthora rubi]|uniref:Uncharacterized protein n=1 Tax=Phytophthora rubi TaxID=129364 RepID=A0A6A4DKR1_9STRA|nr:hypothetical protein PR002_g20047 [Phytophthora rubi]KAE9303848.1 hypothetical protein PR003_g21901 [Phytophthora rubi]
MDKKTAHYRMPKLLVTLVWCQEYLRRLRRLAPSTLRSLRAVLEKQTTPWAIPNRGLRRRMSRALGYSVLTK